MSKKSKSKTQMMLEKYIKYESTSKDGNKKKLSRKTKYRINLLRKQKCKCFWCGKRFDTKTKKGRKKITLDHLLPKSMGGKLNTENLVAACHQCNQTRGNQMTHPVTKEKIDLGRL